MELNYKEFGQGEPLIILHGLFGSLDNWQTIAKQLAKEYTVFIIDQRNHGRSPHTTEFNYTLMAEDLQYFMESHWIYKAHLIGHSMGGKTIMQFAQQSPDMIDKMVVVDMTPKVYPGGHESIFNALLAMDLSTLKDRKQAEKLLLEKIPDYSVRQFLLKNLTRTPEGNYRWKMNLPIIYENYEAILSAIPLEETFKGDTLFLRGGKSNYVKDKDWPFIQAYFTKSHLETIENAGHWVHAETPAPFLQKVIAFLE